VSRAVHQGFILLLGVVVMLIAAKPALFDNADPDLFWHLRVADQLTQTGVGPIVDELSYASVREPWTPYSWLGQLMMKAVWDLGAMPGVLVAQTMLLVTFFALIARIAWEVQLGGTERYSCLCPGDDQPPRRPGYFPAPPSRFSIALATAFAALVSFPYLSFRPAMIALVLLALIAWLVVRDRRLGDASRAVWLVPVLALLCVNIHLYALLVPVLLLLVAATDWITMRTFPRRAFVLSTASCAGCACTPMLPGVLAQSFAYQSADAMVRGGGIAEMQPIWSGWVGCAALAVCGFAVVRGGKRQVWLVACGVASVLLMLRLGRFAPVGMICLAPLLAMALPRLDDRVLGKPALRIGLASLLIAGAARIVLTIPDARDLDRWLVRFGADAPAYPVAAAQFVDDRVQARSGRLVNEFTWGGYLAWRLGDRYRVLLDGRTQLYSDAFWRATYLSDDDSIRPVLAGANADAAIVPAGKSRFRGTLESMGWTVAHQDEIAIVLVPPTSSVDAK
jgi:hypothetical protein